MNIQKAVQLTAEKLAFCPILKHLYNHPSYNKIWAALSQELKQYQ